MCTGFGLIVTSENAYFVEPDTKGDISHREILNRLGWTDSEDQFLRRFVRVEYPNWRCESFRFDEILSLPGWVDEGEIKTRCDAILERVAPLWMEYDAAANALIDAYYAAVLHALEDKYRALQGKYNPMFSALLEAFVKAKTELNGKYDSVSRRSGEYEKSLNALLSEYDLQYASVLSDYKAEKKALDDAKKTPLSYLDREMTSYNEMVAKMSKISGYVPRREWTR